MKIKLKMVLMVVLIIAFVCCLSNKIFARYYEKIEYVEVKGIINESEQG